jgi:hypothetical protein
LNTGIVVVQGNITGRTGTITIAAGGMIEIDHGTLNGGTLNNAANGTVEVTTNGGTLENISVVNAGVRWLSPVALRCGLFQISLKSGPRMGGSRDTRKQFERRAIKRGRPCEILTSSAVRSRLV